MIKAKVHIAQEVVQTFITKLGCCCRTPSGRSWREEPNDNLMQESHNSEHQETSRRRIEQQFEPENIYKYHVGN